MKKYVIMFLVALAISSASAITATKEYVDRRDGEVLQAAKDYTDEHGGGTDDYRDLTNKPNIEGVTLNGRVTLDQIGARSLRNLYAFGADPYGYGRFGIDHWQKIENMFAINLQWNDESRSWKGSGWLSTLYEIRSVEVIGGDDILFSLTENGELIATGKNCLELGGFYAITDETIATMDRKFPGTESFHAVEYARFPLTTSSHGNFYGTYVSADDFPSLWGKPVGRVWLTNSSTGSADTTAHYLQVYKLNEDGDPGTLSEWTLLTYTTSSSTCPTFDANVPNTWRSVYDLRQSVTMEEGDAYLFLFSKSQQSIAAGNSFARRCECGPLTASSQHHGIVTSYSQANNSVTYRDDLSIQLGFGGTINRRNVAAVVNGVYADADGNVNIHPADLNAYTRQEVDSSLQAIEDEIPIVASNVVRQCSWGVWDEDWEVYWSPVMESGKLTYQAITNINLRANGGLNQ